MLDDIGLYEVEFVAPEKDESENSNQSIKETILEDNQVQAALELLKYGKLRQSQQEARSQ